MTGTQKGAINDYYRKSAPKDVRDAIENAGRGDILSPTYPYRQKMKRKDYDRQMDALQIELVKLQAWVKETGQRVAIIFEGRDAAGKGAQQTVGCRTQPVVFPALHSAPALGRRARFF